LTLTLTLLDFNFDFVFDFDFDFDFGAVQNTSQTLATMAIVTLPKRGRTPLRHCVSCCHRAQEARNLLIARGMHLEYLRTLVWNI
jgi:hypothetical protein